jgi:uncharacterized protein (TIGR02266 family)
MNRRESERVVRRVPVRFTARGGGSEALRGYTTNISAGGMFISTGRPLSSGTRIRVEVGEPGREFTVEGLVAHSRRTAPELRVLGMAGMGVRFLSVADLVSELVGAMPGEEPQESSGFLEESAQGEGVYRLRFRSREHFLRVYRQDVVHGGLFVPTRKPAGMAESVTLEVIVPLKGYAPLSFRARVVHRIPPEGSGAGANLLAGMGVQLEDPVAALAALEPVVARLGGRD